MEQAETLAREICKADGLDPDEVVPVTADAADAVREGVPRWHLYEAQARRIIAVQAAL